MSAVTLDILVSRLEQGALVLTVNKRLARYLRQTYDLRQRQAGHSVWQSPAVHSFDGWQRRLCARLGLDDNTLDPVQAQRLWERAVEDDPEVADSGLLRIAEAARQAGKAHLLLCQYGADFPAGEGGADHRAFLRWRQRYNQLCLEGGWDDPALLQGRFLQALQDGAVSLPHEIWLAGFDDCPPMVTRLCAIAEARGATVRHWMPPASPRRKAGLAAFADMEQEVRGCARWVRRMLECQSGSIGVIALDMSGYQHCLQRIFCEELSPGALLPGAGTEKVFNLSLGRPLAKEAMIVAALEWLSLGHVVPLDTLGYLLRSPFIWGHLVEQHSRALLDRELRSLRAGQLPLRQVVRFARQGLRKKIGISDILARQLDAALHILPDSSPRLPGAWARQFALLLEACQWPGDRSLDSREYQIFTAWKELLAGMARLDPVCEPMKRGEALGILRRLAADTVFQPEGSAGRVQVLGALEAAGMQFDAAWVLGVHEEVLPAPARPHPLLPIELQRRFGMPHADAARELDFACKVTERLLVCAPELVVSWPLQLDGRERHPATLVRHLPQILPELSESRCPSGLIKAGDACLESLIDAAGPPVPASARISGGTAILKDQALCPFRAFARHRLGARGLDTASLGFDGLDRGSLVHRVLEWFWEDVRDWWALTALPPETLSGTLAGLAERALEEMETERRIALPPGQKRLEKERLFALLQEWLQAEAQRPPFTVETLESWHRETFGALTLQTRIDRIDRLADGSQIIIDYKTGIASVADWLGDRPVEPQLPLYAMGRGGAGPAAVAFGKLRRGDCGFIGIGRSGELLPGVAAASGHRLLAGSEIADWEGLLRSWRLALQQLGDDFSRGKAVVDPVDSRRACERCDLQPLCRLSERDAMLGGDDLSCN